MSEIKLTADSGGGTTSLKAPSSTTSNADVVLKLPVADGSSGQVLKTDGSGQLSFTSNAGTTINNNADNRVITGSGTASTLNAESNVFIESNGRLGIGTSSPSYPLHVNSGTANSVAIFESTDAGVELEFKDSTGTSFLECRNDFRFENSSGELVRINSDGDLLIGRTSTIDTSEVLGLKGPDHCTLGITSTGTAQSGIIAFNDDDADFRGRIQYNHSGDTMVFRTAATERVRIESDGNFKILDGDLVIGASGHGIDFSDTSDASGKSSELLDDYEEGTWTPVVDTTHISGTPTYHSQLGTYTKIGRQVFINGYLHVNSMSFSTTNAVFKITGLPFNGATTGGGTAQVTGSTVWQQLEWVGSSQSSYGTDNDVVLSPAVNDSNKVVFKTCSQDKYYIGDMLNNAVDGNQALLMFSFFYYTS